MGRLDIKVVLFQAICGGRWLWNELFLVQTLSEHMDLHVPSIVASFWVFAIQKMYQAIEPQRNKRLSISSRIGALRI